MPTIGPIQPGTPYLLPPPSDKKLVKQRKSSYRKAAAEADAAFSQDHSVDEEMDAAFLARFPPGAGPINWIARLVFQTYHSVLRPKLGRIVDIFA
ncbi:MAG: hypothetical protein ACYDAG_11805 [Chloroflexota bacterium]